MTKRRGLNPPPIDEAKYEVGYGLKVSIDNRLIRVGSGRFPKGLAATDSASIMPLRYQA